MTPDAGVPSASSRRLPERIGRYVVTGRLGSGAMGAVYSARDSVIERDVAIKVMNAEVEEHAPSRSRFVREARIGGQLRHRNITTVLDMGEEHGRPFIVMELLHGRPLSEYLEQGHVPLETRLDLMQQLCAGLAAAHAHEVLHRDIKPSNLFVQDDGTLKILDFGVSRLMGATVTSAGFLVGTPEFMAPEQATAQELDPRADLFSSSAVCYYVLSGRKPFAGSTIADVLRKVQRETPPPLSPREAPPLLAELVMRGLSKNRDDRQPSMLALHDEFVRFRRVWEAETKREARRAQQVFETIVNLQAEAAEAEATLGSTPADHERPALDGLADQYPLIADLGPEALARIPFRRDQVVALLHELKTIEGRLQEYLVPLRRQRALQEAADARGHRSMPDSPPSPATVPVVSQSLTTSDATSDIPLGGLELRHHSVGPEALPEGGGRQQALVSDDGGRGARVMAALDTGHQAIERADWEAAIVAAHQALAEDSDCEKALDLLSRAWRGRGEDASCRATVSALGELVGRARQALAAGHAGHALRLAEYARGVSPDDEGAATLVREAMQTASDARCQAEGRRYRQECTRRAQRRVVAARRAAAHRDGVRARQWLSEAMRWDPASDAALALVPVVVAVPDCGSASPFDRIFVILTVCLLALGDAREILERSRRRLVARLQ